ncbi:MAG: DNA primase [Candidatus Pacebacteria bacterium]|nr:DNA primase [Candidatus Paceibacterota bacterium]
MSTNIEQIKERLNIVDVVGSYIKVEKAGSNFKACCPFHNEKTPSFFMSPDRGTFKCFGCGEGGDIFTFVEKYEGVDFKGSLKILADKAGVELIKEDPKKVNEKNRIYDVLEKSTSFFQANLLNNKEALEYLKNRGVEERIIKQFRLGFALDEWQGLYDFLKKEGYTDIEIEKAGLIKKGEKKDKFYDRFRSRIIFPLFDNSDSPVAFSGRLFETNQDKEKASSHEQAKYLNSPETVLFSKSNILYAYNFAKNVIRKLDFSILVEGQMDLLMCHQAGYTNTVASSGTSLTEGHISLLKRFSDKLVIAFDGDEAGFNSASKASKLALVSGMEVRLIKIPEGMDPADLILENKDEWKKNLKNAKHIIDFYLEKLIESIGDKRKLGKEVQEKVLPFVALVQSEIEKENFIELIANKLNISKDAIRSELEKIKIELPKDLKYTSNEMIEELLVKNESNLSGKIIERKNNIIRQLSGLYWWQKGIEAPVIDLKELEVNFIKIVGEDFFQRILDLNEKIKDEVIFEAEIFYQELGNDLIELKNDLNEKIKDLFLNLEMLLLDEKIKDILLKIKEIERLGDDEKLQEQMKKYNEYLKLKDKLNRSEVKEI